MISYTKDLWNNFYVNAISEFMKKRHKEYMRNHPGKKVYHIPMFDWDRSNH